MKAKPHVVIARCTGECTRVPSRGCNSRARRAMSSLLHIAPDARKSNILQTAIDFVIENTISEFHIQFHSNVSKHSVLKYQFFLNFLIYRLISDTVESTRILSCDYVSGRETVVVLSLVFFFF